MEIDENKERLYIKLDEPTQEIFIYKARLKKISHDKLDRIHISLVLD